jgi:aspartyl-tRNA(Asn)/glutamyl-tRNA(Gln) amidotransferase subunit A
MTRRALLQEQGPGIAGLGRQLRAGDATPADLLAACLARIADVDSEVGAITWLDPTAMEQAEKLGRELQAGRVRGPLHGIPIGVKELFDVAGAPATYGSRVLPSTAALADAGIVHRLREAGAVIVGTTRSHEFGWGITTQHHSRGSTHNPWDLDRIPGGSSGGSAAAVAAGMISLAVASDTGGSIRIPAAFCGVAGIKPSYGRITKAGAVALAPSLDTPGFIARSVHDLLEALLVASGVDPLDPTTVIADLAPLRREEVHGMRDTAHGRESLAGLRLGYSPDLLELTTATERLGDFHRALGWAQELGAQLVELTLPRASDFRRAFSVIQMADAVTVHRDVLRTYPGQAGDYGPDVRSRLDAAVGLDVSALLGAVALARQLHAELLIGLQSVDVLLSPISTVPPPLCIDPDHVQVDGAAVPLREAVMGLTTPQNLTGLPAVAVPFGLSSDGLPVGLQVTAARGRELMALRVAAEIEVLPTCPTNPDEGDVLCPR